jgi:phage tail sheath protein FI
MKALGVYITENEHFRSSVVEVPTSVPVFIGYTEKANTGKKTLFDIAWRITSLADYHKCFGGPYKAKFIINKAVNASNVNPDDVVSINGEDYYIDDSNAKILYLYNSLRLFYENGGGVCYIVSVGDYALFDESGFDIERFYAGIDYLLKEPEPTIVLAPDVTIMGVACYSAIYQKILSHCGNEMRNRVAILDLVKGTNQNTISDFREDIGNNYLSYAAAYYPWLQTTIVEHKEIDINSIDARSDLALALKVGNNESSHLKPLFNKIRNKLNILPPSGAMAGLYTRIDNARGVWKAPANESLNCVTAPLVSVTDKELEGLHIDISGKSINVIRHFKGLGPMVWGARTLDGNSLDWRYINVRRMAIYLEQSIKLAVEGYVFEPNVSNTWVSVKAFLSNFLTEVWKYGGLTGVIPSDAFTVQVGLANNMTSDDVLAGIMRVTVLVALVHPAEFLEIIIEQQMQKS